MIVCYDAQVKTIGPLHDRTLSGTTLMPSQPPRFNTIGPDLAYSGLQPGDIVLKMVAHGTVTGEDVQDTSQWTPQQMMDGIQAAPSYTLTVASQGGISGKSNVWPNSCSKKRMLPWLPSDMVDHPDVWNAPQMRN